jgi:hypothetical protein
MLCTVQNVWKYFIRNVNDGHSACLCVVCLHLKKSITMPGIKEVMNITNDGNENCAYNFSKPIFYQKERFDYFYMDTTRGGKRLRTEWQKASHEINRN